MRASLLLLAFMLSACSLPMASRAVNTSAPPVAPDEESVKPPEKISLVKMLSWGAPGTGDCSVDLEGTAPPAHFTLGYTERGSAPVVVGDAEELFARGWMIVNRSVRGYGFEKTSDFTALHVDAVEQLSCECKGNGGVSGDVWTSKTAIHVKIDWEAGGRPNVRAFTGTGDEATAVKPVMIGGRLATYELSFGGPAPLPHTGRCASGFFLALLLSDPLE